MLVTDAQVHIWEVDRPDRPWPTDKRNEPQLPNGWNAEQMLEAMDATGVDRAVIVPPTWAGDHNDTALEAVAAHPGRFAIMGRFVPTTEDAPARLETWLSQPGMLGIRMTFHLTQYVPWLDDGTLDWLWPACERLGIPLMMLVPRLALKLAPVAERHPGLTLIVDHMARGGGGKGAAAFTDLDELLSLARFPNVLVKTTSAPSYSAEPYPFRDIHEPLKRIYDSFGARRMLWGSDFTRLTSTYPECLKLFTEGLDFLSAEDKEWVLGRTAAEALKWPEPAA
jgi:predicted TIM-barrel fold metal-dependent hydrolase